MYTQDRFLVNFENGPEGLQAKNCFKKPKEIKKKNPEESLAWYSYFSTYILCCLKLIFYIQRPKRYHYVTYLADDDAIRFLARS